MSKKNEIVAIEDLQIEALTDEELDGVPGGYLNSSGANSCSCCVAGATDHTVIIEAD